MIRSGSPLAVHVVAQGHAVVDEGLAGSWVRAVWDRRDLRLGRGGGLRGRRGSRLANGEARNGQRQYDDEQLPLHGCSFRTIAAIRSTRAAVLLVGGEYTSRAPGFVPVARVQLLIGTSAVVSSLVMASSVSRRGRFLESILSNPHVKLRA
jgi:hypothetical protein